ncbi:MAG: alkaline phosphatase [Candidatus Krumholzibacteriota bacterium]|nr:alkaline phosphatase [Candidatus Krumholzibacteriota bacterium]
MKKRRFAIWLVVLLSLTLSGWGPGGCGKEEHPRNIILFIGDGMGASHLTAGMIVKGSLELERFPQGGLITTHSADKLVTDSAASGTALATGYKTYNGAISVDRDRKRLKTALEYAEEAGKSTGLVVTCGVTHATPAVFAAHVENRNMHSAIAEQLVSSGMEVLFGGGWSYFSPAGEEPAPGRGEKDLLSLLRERMPVALSAAEFSGLGDSDRAAALLAPEELPPAGRRDITLREMTGKAIQILSRNPKGFFLMVEGSQIDWAAHDGDQDGIIRELIDFDDAVGAGLDFAVGEGGTLVIVTADHETGGFAVHDGSIAERIVSASAFTTNEHTAGMVPLFAYGPGSQRLGGIHDNTFVGRVMIEYITGGGTPPRPR